MVFYSFIPLSEVDAEGSIIIFYTFNFYNIYIYAMYF